MWMHSNEAAFSSVETKSMSTATNIQQWNAMLKLALVISSVSLCDRWDSSFILTEMGYKIRQ